MPSNPAAYVFLSGTQRRHLAAGCGIFTFHKIAPPPPHTCDPFEYTTPATLHERLRALHDAGFETVSLDALSGPQLAPLARRVVITFDDGYQNVTDHALEVLARHRVRAIQFLVAGKLGGQNDWDIAKGDVPERLMDAMQVRDWLAAGHEIGSHSLTHPNLRKISEAAAREEIIVSRKRLEDTFGVAIRHFCYPYGSHHERLAELVEAAGYATACTMQFGVNRPPVSRFRLKRIGPLSGGEVLRKALHRLGRPLRPG